MTQPTATETARPPLLTCGAVVRLSNFGRITRPNKKRWNRTGTVMKVRFRTPHEIWVQWDGMDRLRRYDPDELALAEPQDSNG